MAIDTTNNAADRPVEVRASSKQREEDGSGVRSQSQLSDIPAVDIAALVDSLNDGIYMCDPDRRIIYWSNSAQRSTMRTEKCST